MSASPWSFPYLADPLARRAYITAEWPVGVISVFRDHLERLLGGGLVEDVPL